MSRYQVYVTPGASKEIRELPGNVRQRVKRVVTGFAIDPRPAGSKRLDVPDVAYELYRLRIENWRIVYAVTDVDGIVDVLAVRKRPPYDYGDLGELLRRMN